MKLIFKFNLHTWVYIVGELKNPLLYKNIMMPIIGPTPNTNSTNFAVFFVCPNFWSVELELVWFFLDFFFFMEDILLQRNFKGSWYVIEFEIILQFKEIYMGIKKDNIV